MAFVKVGSVSQLTPGSVLEAEIAGNSYAICNVDGELHALDGVCPHAGGPLGQGALHGATLVCPWHAWEYDCRTGANDFDPDVKVECFPVKVEGGEILIDVPETGAEAPVAG
ncbi:MAG: Rieske (2Fe-2S) protein [Bryobacterales bacterium]|nr:Rieske (2Fe-2S) protein [Bryobacterales bacterium]MBV9396757.1 Rieske (2Fe-2S) protein [Bryobacterales bacterium]